MIPDSSPLWVPDPAQLENFFLKRFWRHLERKFNIHFANYSALQSWSVENPNEFWSEIWDQLQVIGHKGSSVLSYASKTKDNIEDKIQTMIESQWFAGATLNYAENLLSFAGRSPHDEAIVFRGESQQKARMSFAELKNQVAKVQQFLQDKGIQKGDRVVGLLPNLPEAIVCMLATTALGAVWASASPDFGEQGVLDRFGQITPKVLFVVDGYFYNGKTIDCRAKNLQIQEKLPSLVACCEIAYLHLADSPSSMSLQQILAHYPEQEVKFVQVPFSHPLFILFSSGTTGVPKCLIHGHGGTLLQHKKEHLLHSDIRPGDRLFYFTTLGWMMWNWMVSGLASGATLMLYDGSPFAGSESVLFTYAEQEKFTHFGVSAKYLDAVAKAAQQGRLQLKEHFRFTQLRVMFSTGSPLAPEIFDFVYQNIKQDILLASISGGTDIISCFVLGNPLLPVYRGEIQCLGLGMAVEVFNEHGISVREEKGELVCTRPFPSMPIGFWNDPDKKKYREAYFSRFANVWCHGDYVELSKNHGVVIHGRSDTVLNPGGVRIGTAEIYRQVEQLQQIQEALVVGQDWQGDVRIILFVRLHEGIVLDQALENKIKTHIRQNTTARHVPAKILQVTDIPRTKSGKIVELAVRSLIHGKAVKNIEALANPAALAQFQNRPELLT